MNLHKKSNSSAHYGLTRFSDLHPNEFVDLYLNSNLSTQLNRASHKKNKKDKKRKQKRELVIPLKVDWREKNAVTRVHDQGECGACWAYSVVQTIESMYAKKHKLQDLSVEEIIKCAGYTNNGCKGGDICLLLSWMEDTKFTIHSKEDYSANRTSCNLKKPGVQIDDYVCQNLIGSEDIILNLISTNGPVAVAINAKTWQHYIGGVIEYHCDGDVSNLNHAVQIVGYDLSGDTPFYIVRNTWGESFGEKGYLYIAVNKNMCGLANEVAALSIL